MSEEKPDPDRIESLIENTTLSPQEAKVQAHNEQEWSREAIADELDISTNTVREYERRIKQKARQAEMTSQFVADDSADASEDGDTQTKLLLAPCADAAGQEHLQHTVVEGVDVDTYSDLIPDRYHNLETISMWGTGDANATAAEAMQPGDILVFYSGDRTYSHLAVAREIEVNEALAKEIWTPKETEDGELKTWPYVMYLESVQEIDLSSTRLHADIGYDIAYPLGFTKVTGDRLQQMRTDHGSVEAYFEATVAREAAKEGEEIPIDMYTGESQEESYPSEDTSLEELRAEATEKGSTKTSSTTTQQEQYHRSEAVKKYARKRADGHCEGCGKPAPFQSKAGHPYLEVHHVLEVSDDGPDQPDAVIALCPDCHKRVHHGVDANEYNQQLIDKLREIEGFGE